MALRLFAHPLSSYCQKVLIALYENNTAFEWRMLDFGDEQSVAELAAVWPLKRMPVLMDAGKPVIESSIIIEHLDLFHPGPTKLIPHDKKSSLEVRFLDRFFDNYVMTPMQRIVFDSIREPDARSPHTVVESRQLLDTAYEWLEAKLNGFEWAVGEGFTLADCAAAPALFYADWVHPISEEFKALKTYRQRLLARPSFARAVDEARPYRSLFPLGAPDRD